MSQSIALVGDYTVREVDRDTFNDVFNALRSVVFPGVEFPDQAAEPSDSRQRLAERLGDDRFRLHLLIERGDAVAGWSVGVQRSSSEFHMSNSAVLAEHRRRGVYAALLRYVLKRAAAEGFETVTSHHQPTNNAVLIAKLRAGFHISGMVVDDCFGPLVNLTCFLDAGRRAAFGKRADGAGG